MRGTPCTSFSVSLVSDTGHCGRQRCRATSFVCSASMCGASRDGPRPRSRRPRCVREPEFRINFSMNEMERAAQRGLTAVYSVKPYTRVCGIRLSKARSRVERSVVRRTALYAARDLDSTSYSCKAVPCTYGIGYRVKSRAKRKIDGQKIRSRIRRRVIGYCHTVGSLYEYMAHQ